MQVSEKVPRWAPYFRHLEFEFMLETVRCLLCSLLANINNTDSMYVRFSTVWPLDCTAVAGSGKVGPSNLRLTSLVELLLALQLTVLSRCVIVLLSNVLYRLCVFSRMHYLSFRGDCHTTESDLFPFLFIWKLINDGILLYNIKRYKKNSIIILEH